MANVSFNDLQNSNEERNYSVGFFTLKGDNSEAIVRFAVDKLEDLEILTVHPITVGESRFPGNRRVNCLRSPRDPISMCPLCAKGEKINQKVFLKMLQYTSDSNGNVIANPVVWERPASAYANKLKSLLDTFGPLSNLLFKITRHGTGLDTTYDIIGPLPAQMYPDNVYTLNEFEKFENYSVVGGIVMDKNADELNYFITYGEFPAPVQEQTTSIPTTLNATITATTASVQEPMYQPVYTQPTPVSAQPTVEAVPFNPSLATAPPFEKDPVLRDNPFVQQTTVTRPVREPMPTPTKVY